MAAELHLAEDTLALHLLLESAERLVDIVVADDDLHGEKALLSDLIRVHETGPAWPIPENGRGV
jgi:hypothetical protein